MSLEYITRVLADVYKTQELLGFCTVCYFNNWRAQSFRNWICVCPQVSVKTPTLLGHFERANSNHGATHVGIITAI
jgi:hypothetical protein